MMNANQRIWLVRHGETAWSRSGQHTGRSDLPLLPESLPAITVLKPHLPHPFAAVFCSPLLRARQTAAAVGFDSYELDDDLMEWDYGDYNGKTKDDIKKEVPNWSIWTHGPKNGESIEAVAARARRVITRAQAVKGDVALVAHGHLLRILASCWLNLPPVNAEHLALSTASLCVLAYEDGFPVLARWNWRPDPEQGI